MPLIKLAQGLCQFLLTLIALELAFWSQVIKLVLLLIPLRLPINMRKTKGLDIPVLYYIDLTFLS